MKNMIHLLIVICVLMYSTSVESNIIQVPGDQPTIQAGVDAAMNGDTVLVADGTYTGAGNRDIEICGKSIAVRSETGPENCVIDCEGTEEDNHRGFYITYDEIDYPVLLHGFTVKNGYFNEGTGYGGGVCCMSSSSTISNCIFLKNFARFGGGVYLVSSTIINCLIQDNRASGGGGIKCWSATIINCNIIGNEAGGGGGISTTSSYPIIKNTCFYKNTVTGYGGGIYCARYWADIANCTFVGNTALGGGGIYCYRGASAVAQNSIFWNNSPDEIYIYDGYNRVTHSNVKGGISGTGNIDKDPMFVEGADGRFLLSQISAGQSEDSPCVNSGSDLASNICFDSPSGEICMNELWTRKDGIADSEWVDMGCHYSLPKAHDPTGVSISMPLNNFVPGEICLCKARVYNAEDLALSGYPLFIMLEAFDSYYFLPSFSQFDYYRNYRFLPGATTLTIIPEFTWPSGYGTANGLVWYSALTNPEMTELFGEMNTFEFGWSE